MTTALPSSRRLELEIPPPNRLANLPPARLVEAALANDEAILAAEGPLLATTAPHTGRSPNDRFLVRGAETEAQIDWGAVNKPISQAAFDRLYALASEFVRANPVYVFEGYAGADPSSRIKVRVITQRAWHSLFARNMFLREEDPAKLEGFEPDFTVVDIPALQADPERDGTNSSTFIMLDLEQCTALIGGTEYAGEIKKSIFAVMNYILPQSDVLSMHCSANYGRTRDDVALFFGLSGTGKTTLSADPRRTLIGDDEHGWGDEGVFNIEGGCYAKTIRLDPLAEPAIYSTTRRFGTVLENVACDPETRVLDLDDDSLTENTRASYPITHLDNVDLGGVAGHPKVVIFLTCDAFGVIPPISRLDRAQAMYHFLSGYTAKVAGTERGVTEPSATFSACFGAPFMPLPATRYAEMLGDRVRDRDAKVFLVNTGWTGGPYGTGERMSLQVTRRLITAALDGELDTASFTPHPVFGVEVPQTLEGIEPGLLDPRSTWADGAAYDAQAARLAQMFRDNFAAFEATASEAIRAAGPRV